jgi:ABC-type uncharacterized transport system permease subunit
MIYKQKLPNTEPFREFIYTTTTKHTLISKESTPIPLAVNVVIVLFLVNALLVHASRRRGSRDRRWRKHFWQALELLALPLDFANAFAALAADILGQFDQAEDVFLFGGLVVFGCL